MISIPMILMSFCLIQFILMAQAAIVMKHAAYAAARSALVHKCQPIHVKSINEGIFGVAKEIWGGGCTDDAARKKNWENAARIALIPISASNDKSRNRQGSCKHPPALIKMLSEAAGTKSATMTDIMENKACYAFEPDNVIVIADWDTLISGTTFVDNSPRIKVTVKFKLPILTPVRMIFRTGTRSADNTSYWAGEAQVVLL